MKKMSLPKGLKGNNALEKEKEKAIEGLKNDEEVYATIRRLGLSKGQVKEFIGPLLDLQEDLSYCASCPGLEKCKKSNPHFTLRLELDGSYLDRHFDPCLLAQKEARFEDSYLKHEFPLAWRDFDLSSIDRSSKRNDAFLQMSKILMKESKRWLYLMGGKKSGKSVMLASFSNMYAERIATPVAFISVSSLLEELKTLSFNDKEGYAKRFDEYCSCPLMVLDGLGNEYVSEYNFSTFLFPLLTTRGERNLLTCFSSSLSIDEVCSLYKDKVGAIRAKQLYLLLKEYCVKEIDVGTSNLY